MAGPAAGLPRKAAKSAVAVGPRWAGLSRTRGRSRNGFGRPHECGRPGLRGRLADRAPAGPVDKAPFHAERQDAVRREAAYQTRRAGRLRRPPPPVAVAFLARGVAGSKHAGCFRRQSPPGPRCGPPGMWGTQATPGALCPRAPLRRSAGGPFDAGSIRAHAAGISATFPRSRIQAQVCRRIGNFKRFSPRRPGIRPDRQSAFGISG